MPRENGFEKNPERAREAARNQKRGKSLKGILQDVLNRKLPEEVFNKFKKKHGLTENVTQGEAAVLSVIDKLVETGASKSLLEVMKMVGEYREMVGLIGGDEPVQHIHSLSPEAVKVIEDAILRDTTSSS